MGPEQDGAPIPEGRGTLYKLNTTSCFKNLDSVVPNVTISNGLAWNHDGTKMYYIDTETRKVELFDYNPATDSVGTIFCILNIFRELRKKSSIIFFSRE